MNRTALATFSWTCVPISRRRESLVSSSSSRRRASFCAPMAHSRVQHGLLVPVENTEAERDSVQAIKLFEGFNTIGRSDLLVANKQISRKHMSIYASNGMFQVTVEGQNPIVLSRGTEKRELKHQEKASICVGDVLELLPGKYAFKLMEGSNQNTEVKVTAEQQQLLIKRKRQELDDESLARALQAIEDESAHKSSVRHISGLNNSKIQTEISSTSFSGSNNSFKGCIGGHCPRTFQLLKVKGLPSWANSSCVGIQDVIEGDVLFALLSNYMVDLDWLLSACPLLNRVPQVVVVHGESGGSLERLRTGKPSLWRLHKPPLPLSYGTHHSKAMILLYQAGVRVIVHTANLIYVDWNNKTQGLWMQDFPYKNEMNKGSVSAFEEDLIEYLEALQWNGCTVDLPNHGTTRIDPLFFKRFDFSSAKVRLIASVPGYHQGHNLRKWGHMKLRLILDKHHFDEGFVKSPLVYQFSSLGSLDEKWLSEFSVSTSSGSTLQKKPLGPGNFQILWPTVEDVRCSIEGYAAGNAIPSPLKNVEKDFLRKYWARWHADHSGRKHAMPHFKSYVRYNAQKLAWFLLTSANLSKAAWGSLQKNGSQLMIRSYELGVLFLPDLPHTATSFSCTGAKTQKSSTGGVFVASHNLDLRATTSETADMPVSGTDQPRIKFVTTCYEGNNDLEEKNSLLEFPIPYKLPPERYGSEDVPWSWDRQYFKPDTYGELWPRVVKLYGTKDDHNSQ